MPFTTGTFANVAGASSAVAGNIIQSAVWDAIHVDYAAAFNQLMGQMLATSGVKNIMWMNGSLDVWQRGAGSAATFSIAASSTAYTADRWYLTTLANQACVVAAAAALNNQSIKAGSVTRTAAQTGTGVLVFGYPLDTEEIINMRGKALAFSCLLSAGANWSPASGTLSVALYAGTGAVAKRGGGFTSETTILSGSSNLTAGGSSVALSIVGTTVVPLTATQAELQFTWTPVGVAGAADTFTVDDVQLETIQTTTWTPSNFDRTPFPRMLTGCKRHYRKSFGYGVAPAAGAGNDNAVSLISQATARISLWWQYDVEMRANPTFTKYCPTTATSSNWQDITGAATLSASVDTVNNTSATKGILIYGATAAAVDRFIAIHIQADAGI